MEDFPFVKGPECQVSRVNTGEVWASVGPSIK